MYKLKFQGAFGIPQDEETYILSLTDEQEERAVSVVTSRSMAYEFRDIQDKAVNTKDRLPFVLCHLIDKGLGFHHRISFHGVKDVGLQANLVDLVTDEHIPLRQDDAVLLSVVAGIDMYADIDVFRYFSTPFNNKTMQVALPILSLPDKMLQVALKEAINQENYESASYIRDEINRRKQQKVSKAE